LIQRAELSSDTRNTPCFYVHSSMCRSASVSQPLLRWAHLPSFNFQHMSEFCISPGRHRRNVWRVGTNNVY